MDIDQDMITEANQQENALMGSDPAVLAATNQYLQQRIVLLRASANKIQAENEELRAQLDSLLGSEDKSEE
jgi:hypothetical protein